jgi:hypothetical protein
MKFGLLSRPQDPPAAANTAGTLAGDPRRRQAGRGLGFEIIASIRQFQAAIDMDYMVISMRMGTGPGHAEEMEAIARYGREVIPAFR